MTQQRAAAVALYFGTQCSARTVHFGIIAFLQKCLDQFRLECKGSKIVYRLEGQRLLDNENSNNIQRPFSSC